MNYESKAIIGYENTTNVFVVKIGTTVAFLDGEDMSEALIQEVKNAMQTTGEKTDA